MSSHLARLVVVALALGLAMPAGISAQPADSAAEALARPISPGSVALLLPFSDRPAVVERLTRALADPRPEVRAIAARVAFTTRNTLLAQALTDALAREQSPAAGAEIVRALTLIRGAAADAAIRVALERLDSRASATWIEILCRVRPADLWRQLPELPKATVSGQALAEAARLQPDAAARVFANLKDTPALVQPYVAMLSEAHLRGKLPPWPVLASGLAAGGRPRIATAYLLVRAQARGEPLPGEAIEAIRALSTPDNALDLAWLPIYQELARRAPPNTGPRSMADAIAILNVLNLPDGLAYDPVLARLDASEVAAFQRVLGPNWKPVEMPQRPAAPALPAVASATASAPPSSQVTRLARPMTVILMRDLVKLLDCRLADDQVAVIDVQYRVTGQVRSVSRALAASPEGCLAMASVLAALEVAPGIEPVPDARVDRLVIGMRRSDLDCERQPPERQAPSVRPGAGVTVPKKTRNVTPHYPQSLIEARVQGVVIVEATIPVSGCVADATVLRSPHPGLDVASLLAVSEWRYEPARLDGTPVPVIMTVTVNFSLQ